MEWWKNGKMTICSVVMEYGKKNVRTNPIFQHSNIPTTDYSKNKNG